MEAPAKRLLTSDAHDAILAANVSRCDFISDDLTARLQNVGSRVRKSVAEGYSTPVPSPLTQSPAKQHHTTPVGFVPSANQILQNVFGSPTRFGATAASAPSPSPSPRKRTREDDWAPEVDADAMDCCESVQVDDSDDSDDEVLITPSVVGGGFPNVLANARPMRPLRRPRIAQPVFGAKPTAAASQAVVQSQDITMDYLPSVTHLHHHHHHNHHHVVPLPVTVTVTVGGGDDFGGQV